MTPRARTTAHAEADIISIMKWIARDSTRAAIRWVEELDDQFQKIAAMPGIGTDRSNLRPRVRSVPFGNYLIFFRPTRTGITVVRVISGHRDYARLFARD